MSRSSFERIVGGISSAEKERIIRGMEDRFDDQEFRDLVGKEREKTPEELQIIAIANEVTNELRKKYGLDDFDIPAQNIHIIKEDEWPERGKGSAMYVSSFQGVATREQESNLVSLEKILHEMLHFKSYNAIQVTKSEDPQLAEYRLGLVVRSRDGETMYFKNLNEAVTAEITKELMRKAARGPLFEKEAEDTRKLSELYPHATAADGEPLFDDDTYQAQLLDKTTLRDKIGRLLGTERSRKISVEKFTYREERSILAELVAKLFERNRKDFHNADEVMDLFKKSMMTGNILSLGKLIDGTFGTGTLRKIGELDSDIDAQTKFIQSL